MNKRFLEAFVLFALVSFVRIRQTIGQESVKKNNGNNYGQKSSCLRATASIQVLYWIFIQPN
ncbi:hypothetical protein DN399_10250 [Bacillus sp. AR4-2]|nr:hypothetical protein DN399_10250 [Bacillus sp. AR4-2]QEL73711.1 hypothetical protein DN405_10255 [Bacillus sp. SH8-8]